MAALLIQNGSMNLMNGSKIKKQTNKWFVALSEEEIENGNATIVVTVVKMFLEGLTLIN